MPKGIKGFQKGHKKFNHHSFQKGHGINFGKRHSEETKRKIGLKHKGKHFSPKTEFKKGCVSVRKNKKFPQVSGERCHFWKGGITKLCILIRNSFKNHQWRSDVFQRDGWTCQTCGLHSGTGKAVYLEAHHIKEFSKIMGEYKIKSLEEALDCEELWNINNGLTLCKKCHNKTKKGRKII